MPAVRRRFGANTGYVRAQALPTPRTPQEVEDDTRKAEGSRLSQQLQTALNTQRLAEINDPFFKMVNQFDAQVKFLKSQETFMKLAKDDPQGFLDDAYPKLRSMSEDDPQYTLWKEAIARAEKKLEDKKWSNDLELGLKEYEDYKKYLRAELDKAKPGTSSASELIQAIAAVDKSIAARDEAKRDQAALLSYSQSKDHGAYKEYLASKFLRVKDPTVQNAILKQVTELDGRIVKDQQVKRAQKRSDIVTNYLHKGGDPAKAIEQIQTLALEKGISAEEVEALQKTIDSIVKREEDKIEQAAKKAAAGGAAGRAAAATAINAEVAAAERQYATVEQEIKTILKEGGVPPKEMLDRLDAAATVLEAKYNSAGMNHPNQSDADKLLMAALKVDADVAGIKSSVDTAALKGVDLSDTGKSAFAAAVATASNSKTADGFEAAADIAHTRILALVQAQNRLVTPGAQDAARDEIARVAALERAQIQKLALYKPKDDAAKGELDQAFARYKADESLPDGNKLEQSEFERAIRNAVSADDLASKLGYKENKTTETQLVDQTGLFGQKLEPKENEVEVPVFTEEALLRLKTTAEKSEGRRSNQDIGREIDLWTRLVRTPGVPVSPGERMLYDYYGVGGILDEGAKAIRLAAITQPATAMEVDDYMDSIRGDYKGPAGAMASMPGQAVEEEEGYNAPAFNETQFSEFEYPGMGMEGGTQPTANELAPEETPGDYMSPRNRALQGGLSDPWEYVDPVEDAFNYLDRPEDVDLPGFTLPDLPDETPFNPYITKTDFGGASPWESGLDKQYEDRELDFDPWHSTISSPKEAAEPAGPGAYTPSGPWIPE